MGSYLEKMGCADSTTEQHVQYVQGDGDREICWPAGDFPRKYTGSPARQVGSIHAHQMQINQEVGTSVSNAELAPLRSPSAPVSLPVLVTHRGPAFELPLVWQAIFNKLCGRVINALPHPPGDITRKYAERPDKTDQDTYQMHINQEAIFDRLRVHAADDRWPELPYPPEDTARKLARKSDYSYQMHINQEVVRAASRTPDWHHSAHRHAPWSRVRALVWQAIFNKLCGHRVNALPYPPGEIARKYAGRPCKSDLQYTYQMHLNQEAIFSKLLKVIGDD